MLTAQSIALVHACPHPLEQHFWPGPHGKPGTQRSTHIPNPVGLGHTTTLKRYNTICTVHKCQDKDVTVCG